MDPFWLIAAGLVALIAAMFVLSLRIEKRRRAAFEAAIAALGGVFTWRPTAAPSASAFAAVGAPKTLRNGAAGIRWCATLQDNSLTTTLLEHRFTTHAGKSNVTHVHSIASVPCPLPWPPLTVRRAHLGDAIARTFGRREMTLENENFNKVFRVETTDENFSLVFLSPEVQRWLLDLPRLWTLRVSAGALSLWNTGTLKPELMTRLATAPAHLLSLLQPELFLEPAPPPPPPPPPSGNA